MRVSRATDARRKSQLGQFLTPASTAIFMARLFPTSRGVCRLLDAGAGIGSLSSAFLDRCAEQDFHFERIHVTADEMDESNWST
ncbi:hypothetical protein CCR95_03185 [Thiocystis minor]|nr:hypothetical protein [Thiocystis minor]